MVRAAHSPNTTESKKRAPTIKKLVRISIAFAEVLAVVKQTGGPKADQMLRDFAKKGWFQKEIVDEYLGVNKHRSRRQPKPRKQSVFDQLKTSSSHRPLPGGMSAKKG
jgi:hypothetical protein